MGYAKSSRYWRSISQAPMWNTVLRFPEPLSSQQMFLILPDILCESSSNNGSAIFPTINLSARYSSSCSPGHQLNIANLSRVTYPPPKRTLRLGASSRFIHSNNPNRGDGKVSAARFERIVGSCWTFV
jgi:hypothetical protein